MLATLIIVFREIIEAGLIVGIVLAASSGVPRRGWWVAYGVAAGAAGACLVAGLCRSARVLVRGLRPGALQRQHPRRRRRHADLAQRLDGEPRPRHGARDARSRRRGRGRAAPARRAVDRGRRRRAARGLGDRALPLRHRRVGRHVGAGDARGRRARPRRRRGRVGAPLFRPSGDSGEPALRRDLRPHHAARGRACGASRRLHPAGGRCRDPDRAGVEHVVAACPTTVSWGASCTR